MKDLRTPQNWDFLALGALLPATEQVAFPAVAQTGHPQGMGCRTEMHLQASHCNIARGAGTHPLPKTCHLAPFWLTCSDDSLAPQARRAGLGKYCTFHVFISANLPGLPRTSRGDPRGETGT